MDKILPDIARKANPIDLTGHVLSNPKLFEDACVAVGHDPRTEAVVIQFSSGGRRYLKENAEAFNRFAADQIGPLTAQVGFEGPPEITSYEVHNYLVTR